ncbi:HlyD family efflux transporter periplasmic adaptor subunit [Massilia sp. W12]|uniref:HlyD family efflux transporter periplasmic adaptor subunit n=1 Tax=Massilia sp. W12 TaxID=3126507 RepID=UPI0030D1D2A6
MSQQNPDLQVLGNLLQIEQDVWQAESESALEFIITNDSFRIFPYRQACLWRPGPGGAAHLRLVSGLADVSQDSPYRQWLHDLWRSLPQAELRVLQIDDVAPQLQDGWREWQAGYALWLPLTNAKGQVQGGLWLSCERAPHDAELALLQRLAQLYGHALWAWRQAPSWWRRALSGISRRRRISALVLLAIACLPLRLSALAPAEITGRDALVIAAPSDGVLAQFFITPNQVVAPQAPLFALDDTNVRNRQQVAQKARAVAEADYLRATQKSFSDLASKAELASLKARLDERSAELTFAEELAQRIQVQAPAGGVAVFSDPNDWLGKPVQTGERILLLADPNKVQVSIHLALEDALELAPDAEVKLYLNVQPLNTLHARLTQSSYEAVSGADGVVSYLLKAELAPGQPLPRIGWKGTAKVYGGYAPLIYHVLRKPLAAARRMLGI